MKGIVFNVLEEVVTEAFGLAAWDRLLEESGASGVYTSLGSYDDEEMYRLVRAAGAMLNLSENEVLRWYGRHFVPKMHVRYPEFFTSYTEAQAFLLSLNRIIHPEVRKMYPGASVPVFTFETRADGTLVIGYQSARKMCAFAEGLIQAAAEHYGQTVQLHQPECMLRDDARCLIVCDFNPAHA